MTAPSRKLTVNVTEPVHNRMRELADARQIPVTELLRRVHRSYDILDRLLADHPHLALVLSDTVRIPVADIVPIGADAW